ncbi:MAG: hypothetical protein FJ308_17485 [Planctomycetes bacterium]|nr:hypothetical protein [Planctomycetota bacterium]
MISDQALLAYLDESLADEKMAEIEALLRTDTDLRNRLAELISRRDSGVHTLGDIWRRNRLSCPSREELGSFLLGAIMDDAADYIRFHLESIGCRYCQANLEDLRSKQPENVTSARRQRIFQSSVGRVRHFPE